MFPKVAEGHQFFSDMAHIYIIQSNWSEVWPIVAIKEIIFFVLVFEILKLLPQGNKTAISQHQSPKSIK